jgi:multidrug resistance protein MdtO
MLMHLIADIIDPFPGRAARALEISVVCALVVLVSMTYGIPDPAISAYVIFFAAKEDSGGSIIANIALVVVVTIVVAIAFGLAALSLNSPEARILLLGGWTFAMFFLASASKLASLAGTIGLIIAYAIDLFGSAPLGEIATRGLLYAWLFVAMPMGVFLVYNLLFGRRPDRLASEALARRLRAVAALLGDPNGSGEREHVKENCKGGNDELLKLLKMTGLFRFQPPSRVKQLRALVVMTYNLSVAVLAAVDTEPDVPAHLATRVETLAVAVGRARQGGALSDDAATGESPVALQGLWGAIETLVAEIRSVVVDGAVLELEIPPSPKAKSGLLRPDAFHNPDHTRYASKGTLAVMICYLTFTLLDWPAIHTCMLTCFIVGLTTVGESLQKLLLRITGCLIGAAFGYLAIVYIVPRMDSITELVVLIGAVTLPAAWVAVGRPSVSYIGFQAAFALYLCILQGDLPKFDLTIVRDRTIGIIFGNLVIYLIFTQVFPVSVLSRVRDQLLQLLARSRDLLHAVSEAPAPFEAGWRAAALQASLKEVESSATALGYENPNSAAGRRRRDAIELSIASLRSVIDMICRIAVCSSLDRERVRSDVESGSLKVEAQLADLADALANPVDAGFGAERAERLEATLMAPPWRNGFAELEQGISELSSALYDYRRLLRLEASAHG